MVAGSFCVGQRLFLGGQAHRVSRDLGQGLLAIEELSTGRIQEHTIEGLLHAWKTGDLVIGDGRSTQQDDNALLQAIDRAHEDAFRQSYSQEAQARAQAKLVYVQQLEHLPRTEGVMMAAIQQTWSNQSLWKKAAAFLKAPHFTTVASWIRRYQKAGRDIRALVDRHHDKGSEETRVDPIVCEIVEDLIQTRYLTEERPPLKVIHREARGMIALRNTTRPASQRLKVPSYRYVKRKVNEIAPYDRCVARFGKRVADIQFRMAGRGALAPHPLARACMDHTRMDVFVVDERSRLPLGRPWLTIVIDEYSRYVLGYYLSFEEPSNVSMTRALRHALSPKESSPDVKQPWDAWGVMETLAVDNGMEFHGRAMEAGAGRFGITIQFCPRRKPWFKGKVERFFGTLNTGVLVDMKGRTFSSIVLKGDYDPAKHAVMTLDTLRRVLHMWIVDVYHHEVHRGLEMTPAQAWNEGVARIDRYLPPSSIAVDAAFSASSLRRLTHKGIEFDLLLYNCRELGALRELYGSVIEVEVRTYDDDIGSIVVVAPDGKTLIKVPALDIEYAAGLTRWQHKVCKRFQRRLQEDDAREISLLDARNRIRALIEQDMQLTSRKTRNQQQRFLQQHEPPAPPVALPANETAIESSAIPGPRLVEPELVMAAPHATAMNDDLDAVPTFSGRKVSKGEVL